MFKLAPDVQVYLHRDPIDFRGGINSLTVLVQEEMEMDPFAPAIFAFCIRRRDRMKLLFFDRSGFVLLLKQLTDDKFRWPQRQVTIISLTSSNYSGFSMVLILMQGFATQCGNIELSADGL